MNQDALLASERLCFPSALAYPLCLLTLVGMGFGSVEKKKDILCNHFCVLGWCIRCDCSWYDSFYLCWCTVLNNVRAVFFLSVKQVFPWLVTESWHMLVLHSGSSASVDTSDIISLDFCSWLVFTSNQTEKLLLQMVTNNILISSLHCASRSLTASGWSRRPFCSSPLPLQTVVSALRLGFYSPCLQMLTKQLIMHLTIDIRHATVFHVRLWTFH